MLIWILSKSNYMKEFISTGEMVSLRETFYLDGD